HGRRLCGGAGPLRHIRTQVVRASDPGSCHGRGAGGDGGDGGRRLGRPGHRRRPRAVRQGDSRGSRLRGGSAGARSRRLPFAAPRHRLGAAAMSDGREEMVFYMPHLPVGGAERMLVRLADGLSRRGHAVRILLDRMEGDMLAAVPGSVTVEALDAARSAAAIPRLAGWLRQNQPPILLSALSHQNIVAILARWLARAPTRIVVSEHTILSRQTTETDAWQ